jgi:hypothetical protein
VASVIDWLSDRVRLDLAAFADPGTTVSLNQTAGWLQGTWTQRGKVITSNFRLSKDGGGIRVRTDEGREEKYSSFFASDRMADLKSLARNTTRSLPAVQGYIRPRVTVNDGIVRGNAEDELEAIVRAEDRRTKLVFVTADAGVGKTTLLTELVRRKATDYALARTEALWLYVNAQGSTLARLDQALAAALDDVRAPFPYHAVATLVRADALVLVIDGFDELIGAPGTYDDAYSSLASFLTALDGNGTIIATARSAYYEQEFLSRIGTIPGLAEEAWSLSRVELLAWNEEERFAYLANFAAEHLVAEEDRATFPSRVLGVFEQSGAGDLASKPFFLARVAEFASDGRGLESGASLLDRLVNTYLAREAQGKLVRAHGVPILSDADLSSVYEELANEMWRQETRELSGATFRELIDLMAQLFELDDISRAMVADRLPNSAFVHPGGPPGSISFQHEIFFSYFLAKPILQSIASADAFTIATSLRKGRLPNQAGELVGRSVVKDRKAPSVLQLLAKAPSSISIGAEQIRQNAGSIAAGMMREGLPAKATLNALSFVDVDLSQVQCRDLTLQGCMFRGADLRSASFVASTASSTRFESILLDGNTVFEIKGLEVRDFHGLRFEEPSGRTVSVYAPNDVASILEGARLPSARRQEPTRNIEPEILDLVAKVTRMFERANIASFENELERKRLQRDRYWPLVYGAFLESGVLREELRDAGGNRTPFVRMTVRPVDLMAGLSRDPGMDPRVADFWKRVAQT